MLEINNIKNKLDLALNKKEQYFNKINNIEQKLYKIENHLSQENPSSVVNSNTSSQIEVVKSFENFLKKGELLSNQIRSKALSSSGEEGGVLIKDKLYHSIMKEVHHSSVLRHLASVEKISNSSLEIVKELGNFVSGWVEEKDPRHDTDTPKLVSQKILLHELYAQPRITRKLLQDSSINLDKWIKESIAGSFIKLENDAFINGNGTKKPFGILHYKNNTSIPKVEITNEITASSLLRMINSLEENFLSKAAFLMNRTTLSKIQNIKDDSGRFIWQKSFSESLSQSIFGIPVVCCSNMPNVETGKIPIILADFKATYKIIDHEAISMVRDPYTEKPFIKFYTVKRVGGDLINTNSVVFALCK